MGLLREHADQNSTAKAEKVPPGWKTCQQWAESENLPESTASHMIRKLVRSGKWDCRKFKIQTGSKIYPVPHYKPAK